MRAVFLSHSARRRDAIGNQLAAKVRFLRAQGWDVQVYVQDGRELHPELHDVAVMHTCRSLWRDRGARRGLLQADLVCAAYGCFYDLLHVLPAIQGGGPQLVFDYCGVTPRALWPASDAARLAEAEQKRDLVWYANLAVVNSAAMADELHAATGFPRERIRQAPCWVDTGWFTPGPPTARLRERIGLMDTYVLLFVGRLAANKRPTLLIDALPHLRDLARPVHAVFLGDDADIYQAQADACRERARTLDIADRVHLLGPVDEEELRDWYRTADVLVLPSLHEGFGIPAVEAMACGLPVVAARSAALPETLGDAGSTFTPDDAVDLANKVTQAIGVRARSASEGTTQPLAYAAGSDGADKSLRLAIVSPRFGADFVGGAERSLRLIASTLQQRGHHVEVFTTCTRHESNWANELAAGSERLDGLCVHRFLIDAYDRDQHLSALDVIRRQNGQVEAAIEQQYLQHSLGSQPLVAELGRRRGEFDAIIVGPYLFRLTWQVARSFGKQVLLTPCFHDEPFAQLHELQDAYCGVGGMLYHSPEEKWLAEAKLGINQSNAVVIGTLLEDKGSQAHASQRVGLRIVYCGRYSVEKGVDRLLEFSERYATTHPGQFQLALMGQGSLPLPKASWLEDLGFVTEDRKQRELSRAAALVQLSVNESLSLVALEAWAQGVPVIANAECVVLREQVRRADGGVAISGYAEFAAALDSLWDEPEVWRQRGDNGRRYVDQYYRSEDEFAGRIEGAVENLRRPVAELLRENGRRRAEMFGIPAGERRLAELLEYLSDQPPQPTSMCLDVQAQGESRRVPLGQQSVLVPVRVRNTGVVPAAAEGPARIHIGYVLREASGKPIRRRRRVAGLPALLRPGAEQIVVVPVTPPAVAGSYRLSFQASPARRLLTIEQRSIASSLVVSTETGAAASDVLGPFIQTAQQALNQAHDLARLPDDYRDVTQGLLAGWKHRFKQKLLHQFRRSYVDVLSRQQSEFNQQVLLALCQVLDGLSAAGQAGEGLALREEIRRIMRRADRRLKKIELRLSVLEQSLSEPTGLARRA